MLALGDPFVIEGEEVRQPYAVATLRRWLDVGGELNSRHSFRCGAAQHNKRFGDTRKMELLARGPAIGSSDSMT